MSISASEKQMTEWLEALYLCNDEGPPGEGWKSESLESLITALEEAVDGLQNEITN